MGRGMLLFICLAVWCAGARADTIPLVNKGKELYHSYGCALCHGINGEGNGVSSKRFDPPPTNFHETKAYLHGQDKDSIRRSIQYGIRQNNSIMPAFEDIPKEELEQIADYVQSMQKKR
jgi:mono/diheme cytochrome c family protein